MGDETIWSTLNPGIRLTPRASSLPEPTEIPLEELYVYSTSEDWTVETTEYPEPVVYETSESDFEPISTTLGSTKREISPTLPSTIDLSTLPVFELSTENGEEAATEPTAPTESTDLSQSPVFILPTQPTLESAPIISYTRAVPTTSLSTQELTFPTLPPTPELVPAPTIAAPPKKLLPRREEVGPVVIRKIITAPPMITHAPPPSFMPTIAAPGPSMQRGDFRVESHRVKPLSFPTTAPTSLSVLTFASKELDYYEALPTIRIPEPRVAEEEDPALIEAKVPMPRKAKHIHLPDDYYYEYVDTLGELA